MKDAQQITCQSSHMCTRDPDAWTTIHQQENMAQHLRAVADHGRRQHRTATDLPDFIRPIVPRPHLGSRVVNKRTALFKTMSGMRGRALDCVHPPTVTQRRGNTVTCYERCEMCPHGHGSTMIQTRRSRVFTGNARRAILLKDSAWTDAMFELQTGKLGGCRHEHCFRWGRRDTVTLKVQGQLKGVDHASS